ncbi:MAG TPA: PH domain-containing protein [Bryobacteraceae bacterium]|nr:PH domain-containing protein [Bryobacteraceae bacterium]
MLLRPSLKFVKLSYILCALMAVALGVYLLATVQPFPHAVYLFIVPVILAFFTLIRHIQKRMVKITVLGDRLRYEAGLASKTTRTIELVKVQDVTVTQSIGQRMVNIGDLSIETAGSTSRIEIDSIDRPQQAADHILALARAQRAEPGAPHPGNP